MQANINKLEIMVIDDEIDNLHKGKEMLKCDMKCREVDSVQQNKWNLRLIAGHRDQMRIL